MTPLEALRRSARHMSAAVVTPDPDTRATIVAKADALQLWGLIGTGLGAVVAVLDAIGVYYLAASMGAWYALSPELWDVTAATLRETAVHDLILSAYFGIGGVALWRLTHRIIATMAQSIEGDVHE